MWRPYLPSQYRHAHYHSECSDGLLLLKDYVPRVCVTMSTRKIVLREACHNVLEHAHQPKVV